MFSQIFVISSTSQRLQMYVCCVLQGIFSHTNGDSLATSSSW